jgi:hypothetical protein
VSARTAPPRVRVKLVKTSEGLRTATQIEAAKAGTISDAAAAVAAVQTSASVATTATTVLAVSNTTAITTTTSTTSTDAPVSAANMWREASAAVADKTDVAPLRLVLPPSVVKAVTK